MIISVGCDHAGINLKEKMIPHLIALGHEVIDHGCYSREEKPFFPDVAKQVCQPILEGKAEKGIMFCGTGVGASIACNKIPGIRASIIHDIHLAHQSVEHDHVQVMCIGEKIVGEWLAPDLIERFLTATGDTDERTQIVIKKLCEMDGSAK
ncbi:MAG: RpiB/LacA/LacB family sugar-phosphate isomerase [Clostridiales bacterium]|jgi:ribose 5-phosphate isomerase B|nr:RpiB/LacA/LacB family sugar-phosphate isomerase [Clostridiales bacterium]